MLKENKIRRYSVYYVNEDDEEMYAVVCVPKGEALKVFKEMCDIYPFTDIHLLRHNGCPLEEV